MSAPDSVKLWDKHFVRHIDAAAIQGRVAAIASSLNAEYAGKRPLFIPVLNGSFMFASDLFKQLTMSCEVSFVRYATYKGIESTRNPAGLTGLEADVFGRHVVLIEDIVDTGFTVAAIFEELLHKEPLSIRVASLLFKPGKLKYAAKPDYIGFEVPNDFVVGYGMDYNGLGRNLPHIYTLKDNSR